MNPERFDLRAITPHPWKNGAGVTREIAFGGASAAGLDWRFSVADIARDAPFSMFPGIDRGIVLLAGAGMRLRSVDGSINHALTVPLAPFHFPGDVPLMATLAGGACRDFNVMTRRGQWRSEVRVHNAAATLPEDDTADEGMLLLCCRQAWRVEAETLGVGQGLLWRGPRRRIVVRPVDDGAALLFARLCHDHAP